MKKVIIASKNPVKIKAVERAFAKMFPADKFEFSGVSVPSNVPDQPLSDQETFLGARNRADNAAQEIIDADFYVGIEGGVETIGEEMAAFACVVIKSEGKTKSGEKYGKSRTGTFFLPQKVSELIKQGKELGEADDIVFQRNNSKQENGAIGLLTGNVIDRTSSYVEAVIRALIPFKNPELY